MNISQLKELQRFYTNALEKIATLSAPSKFQLDLQAILFAHHKRVTDMLGKLL
ncbi:hypothetical protein SMX40_000683 [Cronobacter turicensis]|nr:hypothetical protein [Cronobacter turicensis]ELY3625555.1 hypothetical protein [Cronobacter turicensis]